VSLIAIKNQIQSTKNTRKITKAMQLVAASKMKKFQVIAEHSALFARNLMKVLDQTKQTIADTPYGKSEGDKELFILLTSDKGLCGAMNARLSKKLFTSQAWTQLDAENRRIVTVGRKSLEAAKREGLKPAASFVNVTEDMGPLEVMEIVNEIVTLFETDNIGRVHLVSPWYINAFTFEVQVKQMLPLTEDVVKHYAQTETKLSEVDAAYFEPTREEVAEEIALQLIQSLFVEAFYQLKATEYSSRMVAMKQATEAADDQIGILTSKFNKLRQSAITRELAELAAASDAMSQENAYEIFE
jgi:F-type H+-transporting ATPase subunit gamma